MLDIKDPVYRHIKEYLNPLPITDAIYIKYIHCIELVVEINHISLPIRIQCQERGSAEISNEIVCLSYLLMAFNKFSLI